MAEADTKAPRPIPSTEPTTKKTVLNRRGFLGLTGGVLAGALASALFPSSQPPTTEAALSRESNEEELTILHLEDLHGEPIRKFASPYIKKFIPDQEQNGGHMEVIKESNSQAVILQTETGQKAVLVEIDPNIILDQNFTHLRVDYSNGGGPINKASGAEANAVRFIPIAEVKKILTTSDGNLAPTLRLVLVNEPLDKSYLNVCVIPETIIPPEDTLHQTSWTSNHGTESVEVEGITFTNSLTLEENRLIQTGDTITRFSAIFFDKIVGKAS